jgi:phosphoribosylformylglycinamidine cyclo-ligase
VTSYAASGVDYEVLDRAKRAALDAARSTAGYPSARGASIVGGSFGEPATVFRVGGLWLGSVLECLGTKSMLAAAYERATGIDCYEAIGYDTVAAIANDLVCVGALPLVLHAYFATGSASFYSGTRATSLVEGFRKGCEDAGAAWGGGESPTLAGLIDPDSVDLAGSAVGVVRAGFEPWLGQELGAGDEIVLLSSTGLHANGASLARSLLASLGGGIETALSSGATLGEALLAPSRLYVAAVEAIQEAELRVHYASHITGHGLRKLMRADRELRYVVDELPVVPEVLAFLVDTAGLSEREAYATFNMGAGFALVVGAGDGDKAAHAARSSGVEAIVAGRVEQGARSVVLAPLEITYLEEELELR